MNDTETKKTIRQDSAQGQENFLIENSSGVISKLKQLAKNHCLITATFNNGSQSTSTAVLEILKDMDLVALDYGSSETLNSQLLNAKRIFFKTELDGITVQFDTDSITKAKLHGEPVFAIPIPSGLLWMQRRESFRVRIPLGTPVYCEIKLDDGSYRKYKLMDMSSGGLALHDEHHDSCFEEGLTLNACELELPDHGRGQINLKICSTFLVNKNERAEGRRVGCEFAGIGMSFSATIQRYINAIELARRKIED